MDRLVDFALGAGLLAIIGLLAFTAYIYRGRLAEQRRRVKKLKRLYLAEREQVREMARRVVQLESHGERREREMANVRRVMRSPLYRESLEDKQVAISQAALRLEQVIRDGKAALDILRVDDTLKDID